MRPRRRPCSLGRRTAPTRGLTSVARALSLPRPAAPGRARAGPTTRGSATATRQSRRATGRTPGAETPSTGGTPTETPTAWSASPETGSLLADVDPRTDRRSVHAGRHHVTKVALRSAGIPTLSRRPTYEVRC